MFQISVWNQSNRFVCNISNRNLVQPQIARFLCCHSLVNLVYIRHPARESGMSGLCRAALCSLCMAASAFPSFNARSHSSH